MPCGNNFECVSLVSAVVKTVFCLIDIDLMSTNLNSFLLKDEMRNMAISQL